MYKYFGSSYLTISTHCNHRTGNMSKVKRAITACVLFALLIQVESVPPTPRAQESFLLDDYLNGTFVNKNFQGTWISENEFIYYSDGIIAFNVATNKSRVLVESSILNEYGASGYKLSKDQKFLMISYDPISIFRHSVTAKYVIYDIDTKQKYDVHNKERLSLAQWSPVDGSFAYVFENNVYYQSSPSTSPSSKITTDGVVGLIYNGVPDWVYEEEVLGTGSALWFSPDGKKIAIVSFDDRLVKDVSYLMYGKPGSMDDQYAKTITIKYPKVGTTNPKVALKTYDIATRRWTTLDPPEEIKTENVIFTVTWASNNVLTPVWTNRIQNLAILMSCDTTTGACTELTRLNQNNGWLDIWEPVYNSEGTAFVWIKSQKDDETNENFKHLVHLQINGKNIVEKRLSSGPKEITSILGWDKAAGGVFFSGSFNNEPSQQHIYHVNLNTNEETCISCDSGIISQPEGQCLSATASFSTDYTYMALSCVGPNPTVVHIRKTYDKAQPALLWEGNEKLRTDLEGKLMPQKLDLMIEVKDSYQAKVRLLLPPGLDMNESKKYPMLVNVYGGPNSNQISDRFSLGFQSYMTTNRNVIYAYIDGRGSGRKGESMMFEIYEKMGTVEIEDQINVTRQLQAKYSWIDESKTAIWGWSYGGYATAMSLVKDTESVFKCGISVAPVTSWIYYDSIYTERYMNVPTANEEGYNNTDVTRLVEGFKDKQFFLIHGNADDNVHYQQGMALARALELADIPFRQMSYPDENHGLGGVSRHLYHAMDEFWAECLELNQQQPDGNSALSVYSSLCFVLIAGLIQFMV